MDDVNSDDDYTVVVQREAESTTPRDGTLGNVSDNPSELSHAFCLNYVHVRY